MSDAKHVQLSVLIPMFNEAAGLPAFHASLLNVLAGIGSFEVIYCDDGSSDESASLVRSWHHDDKRVKLIQLSRNFGKEYALSALIHSAHGQALMMLDADGQHPVEKIPDFVAKWHEGAQVVVGLSKAYKRNGAMKRMGSKLFYKSFNKVASQDLLEGSSDFRLISREVQQEFIKLPESDRITRGLIDWLGFSREYVEYETKERLEGEASYSRRKLIGLAMNSFVSMSPKPLYVFGYIGVVLSTLSFLLGTVVFTEQIILEDPLDWNVTSPAMLGILLIFMVGIVLMSQGILSLYISHINNQSKHRPLYIIDYSRSAGIHQSDEA